MSNKNKIPEPVITRLPKYYRVLKDLIDQGINRTSSGKLSRIMKTSQSQVRQDLNLFGGFGLHGYGYDVENLYGEIGKILGIEKIHNVIVLGAGNLARALVKNNEFSQHGFIFCSLFDIDGTLCGKSINGVKIRNISELDDYIRNNSTDIAVFTVPAKESKNISDLLYNLGIRCFLNFTNTELELPEDAIVKDIHLLDALLELSFELSYRISKMKNS